MMALVFYFWLGPRGAVAEVLAEVLIGLAVIGGGGGRRRVRRTLHLLLELMCLRPLPAV